jgi:TIR domain/Polyglycine hydrolase-like, structural repeat
MARVFVSYRRADSDVIAGRIRDRLARDYGDDRVYMDIDNIPFGTDFREHVRGALLKNDVVVAVIGPNWLGRDGDQIRIQDETDPVRVEIEAALKQGTPVIPLLVHGASMPKPADLPSLLKNFAFHNAATIDSGRDFHQHMDRLIRAIDQLVNGRSAGISNRKAMVAAALSLAGLIILGGSGWWLYSHLRVAEQPSALPAPVPSVATVAPAPLPAQPTIAQPAEWRAFHDMPAGEMSGKFRELSGQQFRILAMSGYESDGGIRYASLWIKANWPQYYSWGMPLRQHQEHHQQKTKEGLRPVWISAHLESNEVRYSGIWIRTEEKPWQARQDLTAAELQVTLDYFAKEGLAPVHIYGYPNGSVANFAVILEPAAPPGRFAKFDLARPDYQRAVDDYAKQGYSVRIMSGYRVANAEYWAAVWEKKSGSGPVRSNLSRDQYLSYFDEYSKQGFRISALNAFSGLQGVRYNTVWQK